MHTNSGLIFTLTAAALLACGCTPAQWMKDGAAPEEMRQALSECTRQAWREADLPAAAHTPRQDTPIVIPNNRGGASVVMSQPSPDPFADWPQRERQFAEACMRAKGYELTSGSK